MRQAESESTVIPVRKTGLFEVVKGLARLPKEHFTVFVGRRGMDAADTVIFQHQDRWWMITSVRQDSSKAARWLAQDNRDYYGEFIAFDVRDRVSYQQYVPFWPKAVRPGMRFPHQ